MEQENGNTVITLEDLARMVARGFEETAKKADMEARFNNVDKRFDRVEGRLDKVEERLDTVDGRLDHMDAHMGRMEADLGEIRGNLVYRYEFEDLMARVKYMETKLGVESGA